MTSEAEGRLNERGLVFQERGFDDEVENLGVVCLWPKEEGTRVVVYVKPDLEIEQRTRFAEWVEERLDRYFEHGAEPDGWMLRSDGGWQLHGREVYLPSLD